MRLGCYGSLDQAGQIKAAGFDFLEVDAQSVLRGHEGSGDWSRGVPAIDKLPLPIEVASGLLPDDQPVIGPKRNWVELQSYMQRLAQRAQRLGISCLVFDSGPARRRPEGVNSLTAWEQLVEFVRMSAEVCAHHGVTLAVEAISHDQTNTLNRLRQVEQVCDQVAHRCVGAVVDSVQFSVEREPDDAVLGLGDRLIHVHLSGPVSELSALGSGPAPTGGQAEGSDLEHLISLLRKSGYTGRVSVKPEGRPPDDRWGPGLVRALRETWDQAGRFIE